MLTRYSDPGESYRLKDKSKAGLLHGLIGLTVAGKSRSEAKALKKARLKGWRAGQLKDLEFGSSWPRLLRQSVMKRRPCQCYICS